MLTKKALFLAIFPPAALNLPAFPLGLKTAGESFSATDLLQHFEFHRSGTYGALMLCLGFCSG
jgi:hypothetical protein